MPMQQMPSEQSKRRHKLLEANRFDLLLSRPGKMPRCIKLGGPRGQIESAGFQCKRVKAHHLKRTLTLLSGVPRLWPVGEDSDLADVPLCREGGGQQQQEPDAGGSGSEP